MEHFILMKMRAYSRYSEKDFEIGYWRTKTGLDNEETITFSVH